MVDHFEAEEEDNLAARLAGTAALVVDVEIAYLEIAVLLADVGNADASENSAGVFQGVEHSEVRWDFRRRAYVEVETVVQESPRQATANVEGVQHSAVDSAGTAVLEDMARDWDMDRHCILELALVGVVAEFWMAGLAAGLGCSGE